MLDERDQKLQRLEKINTLLNPQNFLKFKKGLENREKYLQLIDTSDIDREIRKYILELQKIFLSCYEIKIEKANTKQELVKLIYEFRYYCLIPLTENKSINEVKEIFQDIKEIQMLLLKKAHELKIIDILSNDYRIDYQILKNIFNIRVINLEDLYIKLTKEKEKYYLQLFDENIFEEKIELKNLGNLNKKDLTFKINKKIKIFN